MIIAFACNTGCKKNSSNPVTPQAPMQMTITPERIQTTVGSSIQLELSLANVTGSVFAVATQIEYDNRVLQFDSSASESGLWIGNSSINFAHADSGVIHLSISRLRGDTPCLGSGTIARLKFIAISSGTTQVTVPVDQLHLYDSNGTELGNTDLDSDSTTVIVN